MHDEPLNPTELEASKVLTGLSRGRFGEIPPERIAAHVMAVTPDADWPVRKAALDALARRYRFAQRDELVLAARPKRGPFGAYRTKSLSRPGRRGARPYETALRSLDPVSLSCSCADFVRSSLGLCKHGLVVLEALGKQVQNKALPSAALSDPSAPSLHWDFAHPLRGSGDRLERLRYQHAGRGKPPSGFRHGRAMPAVLRSPQSRMAFIKELNRRIERGGLACDPSVATLLHEEAARAARELVCQVAARDGMKSLSSLKRKLYPYQREGVQRFFSAGRLLLADDMGLGKTTQAIACCHGLFAAKRIRRGLLIVPAALKQQWRREWEATTSTPLAVVEGSPTERSRFYADTKQGFLIVGYEQLLRDFAHVERFAPELVVLDEAQRIKNWATKSAAYVKALSPSYRLVLTGTPMENRFDELASIMDFVDDLALEPKWRLVPFHTIQAGDGGKGVGGARNLDVLRERLASCMVRRVRQDVLSQLPPRTDTRVPVEMTEAQRERHEELRRPIAELMTKAQRRPLTQAEFLRLMQLLTTQRVICNGLAQLQFAEEWPHYQATQPTPANLEAMFAPKLAALRALIEQVVIGQGRKAVIFSQWRSMLKLSEWAARDLLARADMRAVFFTGAESPKLREQAIVELHDDPRTTVMFLSDAGGVGLNLQRAANCCINLELPWNPAVLEQRIGRIYRLGQDLPIDVYNLATEEGIEARIAGLIAQKKAVFSSLFDGTSDQVVFDGASSFMEGVKMLVDPVPVPERLVLEADEASDLVVPAGHDLLLADEPDALMAEVNGAASTNGAARMDGGDAATNGAVSSHGSADAASDRPPSAGADAATAAGLVVARLPDGGLRIDAPPALAHPLAELLESLARSLRAAAAE